jgi:hypothetical protein
MFRNSSSGQCRKLHPNPPVLDLRLVQFLQSKPYDVFIQFVYYNLADCNTPRKQESRHLSPKIPESGNQNVVLLTELVFQDA